LSYRLKFVGRSGRVFLFLFSHPSQKDSDRFCETVYLIDNDGNISEFLQMRTGRDPKGMDMDINGNVWLGTTVGLFYISH
jgi:hypothetical protein